MTTEVVDIAKTVVRDLALCGADAIHLASALILRNRLSVEEDQLTLVASDRELKEAAQLSNPAIIDPEEQGGYRVKSTCCRFRQRTISNT